MTSPILGPGRGNPTPRRQGRRPEHRSVRRRRHREAGPVNPVNRYSRKRGVLVFDLRSPAKRRLVEAIGVTPFRTQVKRCKASATGKSACSDKAQYLRELLVYWRRDGVEIQASYPGRPVGFRWKPVGQRTQEQRLMAQQESDHRVVPEGHRKGARIHSDERTEEGRR